MRRKSRGFALAGVFTDASLLVRSLISKPCILIFVRIMSNLDL
jgi:hypothetical protein